MRGSRAGDAVARLREIERYDPARSGNQVFPWLAGLARNEITRALGRERHAQSLEAQWNRIDRDLRDIFTRLDSQVLPDELMQREETRALVNATMAQLPPHYRSALEAKYVDGRTMREIAQQSGGTEKAIESLLTRARDAFRETFLTLTKHLELGTT